LTSSCEPPASPATIPECIARSDTGSLAPRQRVPLDHLLEEVPSCLPGAPLPQPPVRPRVRPLVLGRVPVRQPAFSLRCVAVDGTHHWFHWSTGWKF
jgi:hypothetical protein